MRYARLLVLVSVVLTTGFFLQEQSSVAADLSLPPGYPERSLGRMDAPVTVYEYSSLMCPHCADFHRDTLPKLKASYIDTGKVRLVLRDYPLDRLSLVGAMMARCAPEQHYYKIVDILFSGQQGLVSAENPLETLKQTGRLAGMSDASLDACFSNESLLSAIQTVQEDARRIFDIRSTPSFVINGVLHAGTQDYAGLSVALDRVLAKQDVSR